MSLIVAPVNNPTLTGATLANSGTGLKVAPVNNPTLTGVSVANPAPLTNNVPKAATATSTSSGNSTLDAEIAALQAQIGAASAKVYSPVLNTTQVYNQASATAAANVNPYYTKLLNDFITNQATAKQQQQQQTDVNVQNMKDQLAQLQQANATTGERATEDTATAEQNINQTADNRQLDQGTAFDAARSAQAGNLAEAGLTGSGLGEKAEATAQNTQDVTEARQGQADQQAKDSAELSKARTFEDLATSNTNATSAEAKGETQAQFDLNKFITGQTQDLASEQQTLEQQRQAALATERQNQTKILVNNFINSISNPAQRQAAIQTYGNFA